MNPTAILTATIVVCLCLLLIRSLGGNLWTCWLAAVIVGVFGSTDYSRALLILGVCGGMLEYFTSRHVEPR